MLELPADESWPIPLHKGGKDPQVKQGLYKYNLRDSTDSYSPKTMQGIHKEESGTIEKEHENL